jgi:glucose/arabinose dehydrogenase
MRSIGASWRGASRGASDDRAQCGSGLVHAPSRSTNRTMTAPLCLVALLALAASCSAQDEEEAPWPAGPAVRYVDAFPAQAGFDRPLFVAFHETDPANAYVARSGTSAERRLFLDLSERVFLDNWEEGLLGFAFDPAYRDNGHVFVYWSEKTPATKQRMANGKEASSNRRSVVSRFTAKDGDAGRTVDLTTELRVLEVFQPFGNHNGGTVVFGPDGMLYVALGDGGAANDPFGNSQSKQMLLGKVLRIDVRGATAERPYQVPADNPFVGEEGARGEIWCYGLRNPWRIAFDRATGELWCGDVGQNRLEEVDRLVRGGNYGWNFMEASEEFALRRDKTPVPAGLLPPVASYPRSAGLSITGGHVYRGKAIPGLVGWFVYGDFMTSGMWACQEGRDGKPHQVVQLASGPQQVSSFAEEPEGELLFTGFASRKQARIWRLVPGSTGD